MLCYGSVNVWGGIIGHNKTPLIRLQDRVTWETYIRDVLRKHVVQDDAPPHRAILTKDFLFDADIPLLPGPVVSSNPNPIENVWATLRDALKQHPQQANSDELFAVLSALWDGIDAYPY